MTSFVDCNEIFFLGTFVILLCAAFVGVVCFAISLSYRLKLRYFCRNYFVRMRGSEFCFWQRIRIRI